MTARSNDSLDDILVCPKTLASTISHLQDSYIYVLYSPYTPIVLVRWFEIRLDCCAEAGTYFTPGTRVRITYGDRWTGAQQCVGVGYVALRRNPLALILLNNKRSRVGPVIGTSRIVKIVQPSRNIVMYRHPLYHVPEPEEVVEEAVAPQITRTRRHIIVREEE